MSQELDGTGAVLLDVAEKEDEDEYEDEDEDDEGQEREEEALKVLEQTQDQHAEESGNNRANDELAEDDDGGDPDDGGEDENEDEDGVEIDRAEENGRFSVAGSTCADLAKKSAAVESTANSLQPGASACSSYDILPTMASPHSTSINALCCTRDMRWIFTGGEDGYIRKFDFVASINGKLPLTGGQKNQMVDSIVKAGVLMSYWENFEAAADKVSSVYTLAVHSEALWLLSGLESGGINLQTVRHDEGRVVARLLAHSAPVSVISLNSDEKSCLSGSWDRTIINWDLDYGKIIATFQGQGIGQVSTLAYRPLGGTIAPSPGKPNTDTPGSNLSYDTLFDSATHTEDDYKVKLSSNETTFLASSIDGSINIWDTRSSSSIAELNIPKGVPKWCMNACWSLDGRKIYAGRRNGQIDEYDLLFSNKESTRTFKLPFNSGPVTALCPLPNGRHILCGSTDNIRLYDVSEFSGNGAVPFLIIPGHHGGCVSTIFVDASCRFMFTASGNRGWIGTPSTEVLLAHEITVPCD